MQYVVLGWILGQEEQVKSGVVTSNVPMLMS